jgi:hypothetical protein
MLSITCEVDICTAGGVGVGGRGGLSMSSSTDTNLPSCNLYTNGFLSRNSDGTAPCGILMSSLGLCGSVGGLTEMFCRCEVFVVEVDVEVVAAVLDFFFFSASVFLGGCS